MSYDIPPDAAVARTVMIERYADHADRSKWGGIETAYRSLARALPRSGLDVIWYTADECPNAAALLHRVEQDSVSAVFPLSENAVFRSADAAQPVDLRRRIVRIWHDISALAPPFATLAACEAHRAGADSTQCRAAVASPCAYGADIFFYEEPWTRCFPKRSYIPWAADHLPACDYHDPAGHVVLLAGKLPLADLHEIVSACVSLRLRLKVLFNNWSRLGQEAKTYLRQCGLGSEHELVDMYDLELDHQRIFGGACAALVLSHFHETFNFLAAEAVQLGVPVVAFARSGATRRSAAPVVDDNLSLLSWLAAGGLATLQPQPRPSWSWRDVATAYAGLVAELDAAWQ